VNFKRRETRFYNKIKTFKNVYYKYLKGRNARVDEEVGQGRLSGLVTKPDGRCPGGSSGGEGGGGRMSYLIVNSLSATKQI